VNKRDFRYLFVLKVKKHSKCPGIYVQKGE
jgi:hypothetical protein